ncbi:hypothetical protein ACFSHT_40205, partial [Paraburkholderia silviterrae]
TLIGCKFLKIDRETHRLTALLPGVFCVAASAAEKRNYADSFAFRQHLFLQSLLKSCWSRAPPFLAAAFAAGTAGSEGGES